MLFTRFLVRLVRHLLGSVLLNRAGRNVARSLRAERAHVIINGGNCHWPGVNWVHYVHAAYRPGRQGVPWLYRIKNRVENFVNCRAERRIFKQSPLLIANSERTKQDLIAHCAVPPKAIQVVYLGMDTAAFRRASQDERLEKRRQLNLTKTDRLILFVGALGLDQRKGIDTLLSSLRFLSSSLARQTTLLVAGPGKLEFWRKFSAAQGHLARVILLGAREDVSDLMAAADLMVSPTRYESYGMAVHEALCRGLPAIVAKAAGVAERFTEDLAELLLPNPDDAVELARRIECFFGEGLRLQPAIDALGGRLLNWSWTDMAAQMSQLIEEND